MTDTTPDARLDHLVERARFCRAGCEASEATAELAAEIRRLRDRIAAARAEIARQDTAADATLRGDAYRALSNALAAVETHLVDPEYRPQGGEGVIPAEGAPAEAAFPRFNPDAVLIVDAHNGDEQWSGRRWNEYADACEHPVTGGLFTVRLVAIASEGAPAGGGEPR